MALQKEIDTDFGVPATYWRIVRVDLNAIDRKVWFVLHGYADKDARARGRQPLLEIPHTIDMGDSDLEDFTRATLYEATKKQKKFAGSEDV